MIHERQEIYFAGEWEMKQEMEAAIEEEVMKLEFLERELERIQEKIFYYSLSSSNIKQYQRSAQCLKKHLRKLNRKIDLKRDYINQMGW